MFFFYSSAAPGGRASQRPIAWARARAFVSDFCRKWMLKTVTNQAGDIVGASNVNFAI
jgi:hypothetical protein